MPIATYDTFLTEGELAEQLGVSGATLEATTTAHLTSIRQTAVHDLEGVLELFLVGRQKSFMGAIRSNSANPFTTILTDHIESIASLSYRTTTDSAIQRSGIVNVNDLTIESLRTSYGEKRFLEVKPSAAWPSNVHESGDALLTMNVGIDDTLVPLLITPRHKQYLLLQATGYFDSRIISTGADMTGGATPLDHDLARKLARGLASSPTPYWERMKLSSAQAFERIGG